MGHVSSWQRRSKRTAHLSTEDESTLISEKPYYGYKKSEKYWGQRRNGWAGAVMVGRGAN